ncbi:MAG TPA: glycosyltransferase family 2 protein [Longimicrobiales bacterium]|nr:glycosyltransferase family 2 protein [Longimicrobiales bacterium]
MIYICIPTHNEQQTVGVVLWKLRQVFADFPRDYQLLVANDASTDRTADVLEPYTRVLPLTVIRNEKRQGYAATLEMLLREAVRRSEYPKRDVVVTLQADFSEEPDDLVALLKRMEAGADVAVGNKVSKEKEPRARRMARALAKFFVRDVKWPEGLETPFDGYRAYRLYAIRRAMEERGGRRLVRYDGWAGHAELLRAVLPHARRVDVIDVVDRTDRLQRPRREQPFAAALQVRAMSGRAEPPGLTGVEELDRIAATAASSRERASLANMAEYAQRAPAANGARRAGSRPPRQREESGRRPESGRGEGRKGRGAAQGEARRGQGRAGAEGRQGAAAGPRTRPKRGGAQTAGQGQEAKPKAEPRPKRAPAPPAAEAAAVAAGAVDAPAPRPKKRRRRRRKSGGAAAAGAGLEQGQQEPQAEATGEASGETHAAGADSPAGPAASGARKKRRRGGRRGGRGRRRTAGTESAAEEGGESMAGVDSTPAAPAAPADAPAPNDDREAVS